MQYLHQPLFWIGGVCVPFLFLLLIVVTRFLGKLYRDYLKGLGILSWPGMVLVMIGLKLVRPKHMKMFVGQNRIWVSPAVKMFEKEG